MKTVFRNCTLLDGTEHMQPQPGMAVIVENGKITGVEPDEGTYVGLEVIDLDGKTLLPGLINLHVHLPGSGKPKKKSGGNPRKLVKFLMSNPLTRAGAARICAGSAKTQLLSGTTTIRCVGGIGTIDSTLRNQINAGKLDGPRMLVADQAVTVPGGHMAGSVAVEASSDEEFIALIHKIAEAKPDIIKLMITGGVLDAKKRGEPGEMRMNAAQVKLCCNEAHRLGYKVAAHVESPEGVRVALANGVDTIEHGAMPDAEIIRLFQETGSAHVCTISPAIPLAKVDPAVVGSNDMTQYNSTVLLEGIIECAKECVAAGVPVGLGTDSVCPFVTQYDMWREVNYFHNFCGVSTAFALYTGTLGNAKIAGVAEETGSIEAGKSADFMVVDGKPLDDLTVLRKPDMVVMRGKVFRHPQVKKFDLVETELDKFNG